MGDETQITSPELRRKGELGDSGSSNTPFTTSITTKKTSIFLYMTKKQAEQQGPEVLDLFNKYNCLTPSDNMIGEDEYALFQNDNISFNNSTTNFSNNNNNNSNSKQTQKEKLSIILREIGHSKDIDNIVENAENSTAVSASTLAQTKYGINLSSGTEKQDNLVKLSNDKFKVLDSKTIDLSGCATQEDKINTLRSAIVATCGENSVYQKHFERLLQGEYTEQEIKQYGLNNVALTEEQCVKYAAVATNHDQSYDLIKSFESLDKDGRTKLVEQISELGKNIQTSVIAGIMTLETDKDDAEKYAKSIMSQDVTISDESFATTELALNELYMNSTQEDAMEFVSDMSHFNNASVQLCAFTMSDKVEQEKVKTGKITQEQYNKNYSEVYAASAHKLKHASKAYSYVSKHANDNNREKTIETLASHAYQIKDEKEREAAINSIKNSPYFSKNIEKKLEESRLKFEQEQKNAKRNQELNDAKDKSLVKTSSSVDGKGNVKLLLPTSTSGEHNVFMKNTTIEKLENQINSLQEYLSSLHSLLEQADNTKIAKELKVKQENISQLLENIINTDGFQGSQHEITLLSMIASLQDNTIINIMVNSPKNVQKYLIDKKVISLADINKTITEADKHLLAEEIQEKLNEYRENSYSFKDNK